MYSVEFVFASDPLKSSILYMFYKLLINFFSSIDLSKFCLFTIFNFEIFVL